MDFLSYYGGLASGIISVHTLPNSIASLVRYNIDTSMTQPYIYLHKTGLFTKHAMAIIPYGSARLNFPINWIDNKK